MVEKCPQKVSSCQGIGEYNRFEEEFVTDMFATVAAMEQVCPIEKRKSLQSCPVFERVRRKAGERRNFFRHFSANLKNWEDREAFVTTEPKNKMFYDLSSVEPVDSLLIDEEKRIADISDNSLPYYSETDWNFSLAINQSNSTTVALDNVVKLDMKLFPVLLLVLVILLFLLLLWTFCTQNLQMVKSTPIQRI